MTTASNEQPVIHGQNFVILSTQDWDALPTRKHRFARWWAAEGNRVLYIEQQMHWAGWLFDIKNQFSRAWRWLQGPREVEPNLWVFTLPIVLPFFQMSGLLNRINNLFLLPVLRTQLHKLGFEHTILWSYTPHSADFVGQIHERAAIYECVDDFTSAKGLVSSEVIGRLERRLIEVVDSVIVTAEALVDSKQTGAKRIDLVPNGVETAHFKRVNDPDLPVAAELAQIKHPVVGYIGAVQYWIDTALLGSVARKHPDWTVVLVGPVNPMADLTPFKGLKNVLMTGRVPYAEVPSYVKAFDVCVNPYILDGVAEHCSPLKLYEYVATGKPVVSVDMPEAQRFAGLIEIAQDADDFVARVEQVVNSEDGMAKQRMAEAEKHTWRSRFEAVSRILYESLEQKID